MIQQESNQTIQERLVRLAEILSPLASTIEYPDSDGEPMAETDVHRDEMTDALLHPLRERYRNELMTYVSGNLFVYYDEGNPQLKVAPDVFVVFGAENYQRRTYKLWEEGKAPDVVFELTSNSTKNQDPGDKRLLYERLGVREYFLFDPLRDYLDPPLQGFRLTGSYYLPLTPQKLPNDNWELESAVLGLLLRTDGETLRLYDPVQGRYLLNRAEEAEARRIAEEGRRIAEAQLAEAQAEIARLRAAAAKDL